jgi:histidinol dehydrogenase
MPVRLDRAEADFEERFARLLDRRQTRPEIAEAVTAIIGAVRRDGDEAVVAYTRQFDRHQATADSLIVSSAELAAAEATVSAEAIAALHFAKKRIEDHHRRQLPKDDRYTDAAGVALGSRWTPLGAVGIYVPGGTAAYPSSVLMNAVPAKIAGVRRIVMVVPSPDGVLNPLVLAAAKLAGVDEIYRIGGAQAVAALAYGTQTIRPVDKIVGPGNAYVAEAKRQVFGIVGIDSIAGPSEVLVIADGDANPDWIAADLLAQAEHDVLAQPILITTSAAVAKQVEESVADQLKTLPRALIAEQSWRNHGATIVVKSLADAAELANRIAAEHVELQVADPESLAKLVVNAGAIFMGAHTPEAIGDYVGGSNHVLPTAGAARFSSGLSVLDFVKQTSILRCGPDQLRALGSAAMTLAEAEGLDAHARSVAIRLNM